MSSLRWNGFLYSVTVSRREGSGTVSRYWHCFICLSSSFVKKRERGVNRGKKESETYEVISHLLKCQKRSRPF